MCFSSSPPTIPIQQAKATPKDVPKVNAPQVAAAGAQAQQTAASKQGSKARIKNKGGAAGLNPLSSTNVATATVLGGTVRKTG